MLEGASADAYSVDILIVEDSPTQREQLRCLLEEHGYGVTVAANGNEALAAARARKPTLVVSDIVMPELDGYGLCAALKADEALRDVPVILLTSLSEPQNIISSLECGADNFIRKPYEEKYLLSRISNIVTSLELRDRGSLRMGVEVYLAGQRHFITSDRQQILDFLISTYEEIALFNDELKAQQRELRDREEELARANAALEARQAQLERTVAEVRVEKERAEALAGINRAVLDATEEGIALVDPEGRVLLRNAAMEALITEISGHPGNAGNFFATAQAVAGLTADPDAWRAFVEAVAAAPAREDLIELELEESGRSFRLYTAPVRAAGGELIGRIFTVRELTAEREIERLKSELVATVSHELRTPLTGILGFSELLFRDVDRETRLRYVSAIHREAERLNTLVNDFLDLQRIESGGFAPRVAPFEVAPLLHEEVELFSAQSGKHRIVLELPPEPLVMLGERERVAQVIANLVSNAIKYSPAGGPVVVTAAAHDDAVRVSVADRGLGIPADQQAQIFRKFFRVDSSDTRRIGGTGLGLALCRELVEAQGGEIGFDSVAGEGSTFWFELRSSAALQADTRDREMPRVPRSTAA